MAKGLYIHIPFCVRKCAYCDFFSCASGSAQLHKAYIDALIKEIDMCKAQELDTIFIGGGTPSCIDESLIAQVLWACGHRFCIAGDVEITIEANPATLTQEKLQTYKEAGINRISMGVQSMNDDELKTLGRLHTACDAIESYHMIRRAGFENVNIDVMFALPAQSLGSFGKTLKAVCDLAPEHISAYSLILEPGTPLYEQHEKQRLSLPDEDTERQMYDLAVSYLDASGYGQYEISNFAKEDRKCRHNLKYWHCDDYAGLGAGAHSYDGERRWANVCDIGEYIKSLSEGCLPIVETTLLSESDKISEFIIMGLRLCDGIDINDFKQRFEKDICDLFGKALARHIRTGFLKTAGERIYLTHQGFSVSNSILCDFV